MDCVICKNKAYIVLEKIDGYIQGSKYDIHECPICKTSFSDPLKSDPFVYNSIYKNPEKIIGYNRYLKYKNNVKSKPFPLEYLASKEAVYWSIQKFLQLAKIGGAILEIGSGLGYTTYALNREGFNCVGIDISMTATEDAKLSFGNYYKTIDIFDESFKERFDLIIATEVIEHVENPVKFISRIKELLKDDGQALITTPNKFFKSKNALWVSDIPPVHLFSFSETSLEKIGEQLDLGTTFIDFSEYNKKHNIYKREVDKQKINIFEHHNQTLLNEDGTPKRKDLIYKIFYNLKQLFPDKIKYLVKKIIYKDIYRYKGEESECLAVIYKKL